MYKASYRAADFRRSSSPTVQSLAAVALGAIVWYGGMRDQLGLYHPGRYRAFVSYLTFMMWPVQDLARVYARPSTVSPQRKEFSNW
ncbi:MAG: hypothetical protein IPJ47_10615 [Anaerolineales bacterium]|nr:hypothetical protein [Anaerolineales bacterium]